MLSVFRTLALLGAIFCLSSGLAVVPAHAATGHATTHHVTKKKHKQVRKSHADSKLRDAQTHLLNLDYYKGKVDGLMGPKTRTAIKNFQRDHKLPATGKLTTKTYDAIVTADKAKTTASLPAPAPLPVPESVPAAPDFYATHPDFYGHYNSSYENPVMLGSPQTLYSRFAKVELTEDTTPGSTKRYNITLNGAPLILVDNQPSVIGVSRTFALGAEDVMIFTSYRDNDPICAYDYHLLVLSADGTKSLAINNCTRGYQAKLSNDSLFITFPETDDGRAAGNTWRYEKGDLERL